MTKLERIKAALRRAMELSQAATPGPWKWGKICEARDSQYQVTHEFIDGDGDDDSLVVCRLSWPGDTEAQDAAFIAHARTLAPAAARALLTAIEMLSDKMKAEPGWDEPDDTQLFANHILETICRDWLEGAE